jgi:hypothetical protein
LLANILHWVLPKSQSNRWDVGLHWVHILTLQAISSRRLQSTQDDPL